MLAPANTAVLAILLALASGCRGREHKPEAGAESRPQTPPDEGPEYPPIDPSSATPLDVLYFPEPVGDGYAHVPVRFGPPLHSGKWLGLANGDGMSLGPKHVIVNHFRSKPDSYGEGDLIKNVLLDVETGEEVIEFAYGRYANWHWGLAIVYKKDDPRPYLLDVEFGDLVLAVPEGKHDYVADENYWLRLSPIAKRVWISALDAKGEYHLYEWEDLRAPPEQPNNPFPFRPGRWDPLRSTELTATDHEELEVVGQPLLPCTRVVLRPPKGYDCLDDDELEDTLPLSDGWRIDKQNGWIFNRQDGRGFDLSALCPAGERAFPGVVRRSPPAAKIVCEQDPSVWYLWTAPDRLEQLDPELARRLNTGDLFLRTHNSINRVELVSGSSPGIDTVLNKDTLQRELIGEDYDENCAFSHPRPGNYRIFGSGCNREGERLAGFEIVDTKRNQVVRFRAADLVVSGSGVAVAVVRRGGRDHVVHVEPATPD